MIHVPSPLYPADWIPSDVEDHWECTPTTFARAAAAWCCAARCVAGPLFPAEFERLAALFHHEQEPNHAELGEMASEALRRAEWLPCGEQHFVSLREPEVFQHRNTYGLCWHTSVQTILVRTAPGWVVRVVGAGGHQLRRESAEMSLIGGAP